MSATTVPGFHSINAASRFISSAALALACKAKNATVAPAESNSHNRFLFIFLFIGLAPLLLSPSDARRELSFHWLHFVGVRTQR
jgi:hypothetical protein